ALIVPLVECGVLVETFIALQPNKLGLVHRGKRLGDLGLADARFALQQQRALQELHKPERGGEITIGHVAYFSQPIGNLFARQMVLTHVARVYPPPSRSANDRAASGCASSRGT